MSRPDTNGPQASPAEAASQAAFLARNFWTDSTIMFGVLGTSVIVNNLTPIGRTLWTWLNANYTDVEISVGWQFVISTAVYWIWASVFFAIDMIRPKWALAYKIQPSKRVTLRDYAEISLTVIRNQILVNIPLAFVMHYAGKWRRISTKSEDLPGPFATVGSYFFGLACIEIGFYYVHRTLHHPRLYPLFHKQHHKWTAPCGLSATYCTMTEHLVSNLLPAIIGPFILGSHMCIFWQNLNILQLGTISTHSGYHFPGLCGLSLFFDFRTP